MPSWPFARLTTYIANSLPVLKSADLNSIQDYIVHLFVGDKTLPSLHVDGSGDNAASASAGDLKASGKAQLGASGWAATTGAMPTVARGDFYKEDSVFAAASVTISVGVVTFQCGKNVTAVAKNANGQFDVTFGTAGGTAVVLVTPEAQMNTGSGSFTSEWYRTDASHIRLLFYNSTTGAAADPAGFSFIAHSL